MKQLHSLLPLLGLLVSAAAGCGSEASDGRALPLLEGPPLWRVDREGTAGEGQALMLQARGACRVRFHLERTGGLSRTGAWRDLAAGQTVGVAWHHTVARPDRDVAAPGPEADGGRTESHGALLTFQFLDRVPDGESLEVRTRPGVGRLLTRDLLPPGRSEALPPRARLELATLAVTDLQHAAATLRSHEWTGRLHIDGERGAADQVEIVRLFLDVEQGSGP